MPTKQLKSCQDKLLCLKHNPFKVILIALNSAETTTEINNKWLQWIQNRPKLNSLFGIKFEAQELALMSAKLLPILEILDLLK